jgi:hypothetical protein
MRHNNFNCLSGSSQKKRRKTSVFKIIMDFLYYDTILTIKQSRVDRLIPKPSLKVPQNKLPYMK